MNERNLYELFECAKAIVPFVGAGLSIPYYPSWSKLLLKLGEAANVNPEVEAFLREGKFEEAAECVYQADTKGFEKGIRYEFREELIKPRPIRGVLSQLPKIGQGVVLTTNFDRVLETAFKEAGTRFEEVFPGTEIIHASDAIQKHRRCLLKLHGDYKDERSRILTLSEYREQYGDGVGKIDVSKSVPKVLHQALVSGTVLFLGCSLQSDRTLDVLRSVAAEYQGTTFFAFLSDRENTAARIKELTQWNICPLFFSDRRYDKLADCLAVLAQHCEKFAPVREPRVLQSAAQNTADHLLSALKSGYIESVLQQTLREGVSLAPRLKERRVDGSWHELPLATSPSALYRRAGLGGASRLLITGGEGSGKTIQLLRCVEALLPRSKDLVNTDTKIPLVFSASSWHDPNRKSGGAKDFRTWITSQLLDQYGIPPAQAAKLMESFRLIYCIDGLDEIHPSCTHEFLEQLSDFIRAGQGRIPAGFILAGRAPSVENLDLLTSLGFTHFDLLPLDDADVQRCFEENGLTLLLELAKEPAVRELLSNPLQLQILATVYSEQYSPEDMETVIQKLRGDSQQWQSDNYDTYFHYRISGFLDRNKDVEKAFSSEDNIVHYLRCIARYLGNIQDFRLDLLQPTELPDRRKVLYRVLTGALISLGVLFTVGIPVFAGLTVDNYFSLHKWGASLQVGLHGLFWAGIVGGLMVGVTYIFLEGIWYAVAVAVAFSVGRVLSEMSAPSNDASSLPMITQIVISFVTAMSFFIYLFWGVGDQAYVIAPIETWTVKRGRMFGGAMFLALVVAAAVYFISPPGGIARGLAFGATIVVFLSRRFGRTPLERPIRVRPNQGILYSAREAAQNAVVVAALCSLAFGLSYGFGFSHSQWQAGLNEGIVNALLALMLLVSFFFFGGLAVVKHIALRATLKKEKMLPIRTEKFLLAMASAGILRNAGGTFRFPHGTVRDHFAASAPGQEWKIRP